MDFQIGRVYKIINTQGNEVYVGSTFNTPSQRWRHHQKNYKRFLNGELKCRVSIFDHFKRDGIDKYKLIPIKEYNCYREHSKDFKHLNVYETLWINKLKCVNETIPYSPLPKKFRAKYYHNKHRDARNEGCRQYKANHKEQISNSNKQYRLANIAAINARESVKITCECGSIVSKRCLLRHKKSQKHIDFVG